MAEFIGARRANPRATTFCAGIALCVLVAAPLCAEHHPSTKAMREMSQQELNQQVRDDLLATLDPNSWIGLGNLVGLRNITLKTRPFGTDFDGVCQRDSVTLRYTDAVPGEANATKPVRPYSIEARPTFHIVHLPRIEKAMGELDPAHIAQPACLDIEKAWRKQARAEGKDLAKWDGASWAEAKDAFHVVQAGFMLDMALAAVRAHTLKPEPCSDNDRSIERSCEETILDAGGVADMTAIESCPAEPGLICARIDFPTGQKLTIVAHGNAEDPVPASIKSIAVEMYITVT
jgi:hypothetical protein